MAPCIEKDQLPSLGNWLGEEESTHLYYLEAAIHRTLCRYLHTPQPGLQSMYVGNNLRLSRSTCNSTHLDHSYRGAKAQAMVSDSGFHVKALTHSNTSLLRLVCLLNTRKDSQIFFRLRATAATLIHLVVRVVSSRVTIFEYQPVCLQSRHVS